VEVDIDSAVVQQQQQQQQLTDARLNEPCRDHGTVPGDKLGLPPGIPLRQPVSNFLAR